MRRVAALYAYPLLGANAEQRTQHLGEITVPTLCVCGTRDRLCPVEHMDAVIASLKANWRMHWIAGADHSFKVLKRSGRSEAEVIDEIGDTTEQWMRSVTGG
jgi:predicted alpha/beta-hydrolase family hydrolase